MRVFVTGGKGDLGRRVTDRLVEAGHEVLVGTRAPAPRADGAREVAYAFGEEHHLDDLLREVDTVVHLATDGAHPQRDVAAMEGLVAAAERAEVAHLLYISIVGIDDHAFPYYRAKLAGEQVLTRGSVPWTILRATQFHTLIDRLGSALMKAPVVLAPRGVRLQLVDAEVVADRLVALVDAGPSGRARDLGGPEVIDAADGVRRFVRAKGSRRPVVRVPVPGKVGRSFRSGQILLGPDGEAAGPSFADHLARIEPRARDGVARFLAAVGWVFVLLAGWMAIAPQGFVANMAAFGETVDHFIRDLSTFTAPLGVALILAASRPSWRRPVLALALLQNGLHLVNHVVDIATTDPAWHGPAAVVQLGVLEVVLFVAWRVTGRADQRTTGREGRPGGDASGGAGADADVDRGNAGAADLRGDSETSTPRASFGA